MAWTLLEGDALAILPTLGRERFSACVTDPPYGLGFMGRQWDAPDNVALRPEVWCELARVLKPGAHLVAFGGPRMWHRLACAIEDAGFEIRDSLAWLFGAGVPKSLDVSKAFDRRRHDRDEVLQVTSWIRAARDAAGVSNREIDQAFGFNGMAGHWTSQASQPEVPTLDQVPRLLDVLGSPEVPPEISLLLVELNGRKGQPGEAWARREVVGRGWDQSAAGTMPTGESKAARMRPDVTAPATELARQWEGWGTALRPAFEPIVLARKPLAGTVAHNVEAHGTGALHVEATQADGRWPPNVAADAAAAALIHRQSDGVRFCYCPKATRAERDAGLGGERNDWPTVKPLALMRWLVRLVAPRGAEVVDPFTGSGSTGLAALAEGCEFTGIDADPTACSIAHRRLAHAAGEHNPDQRQLGLFGK